MKRLVLRGLVIAVACACAVASAQPDPWGGGGGSGSSAPGSSGSGSAGSAPAPGSGSATGGGSGSGSGSGTGSGSGSGTGSGTGKKTITLPADTNAPEVSASASPTVVRIGGKFTVFIVAKFQPGVEVNLREPVNLGEAFEVRRRLSEDGDAGDGRRKREWQLEVMAWELGDIAIAPITVRYSAFGKDSAVETNVIRIRVEGVLGGADDPKLMRGNHAPIGLDATDWFWLWVIGAAIVTGVATATYIYLSRLRRRRTVRLVGGMIASPRRRLDLTSERALERLLAIRQSGVLDRDDDRRAGYQQMTEVIREYVGSRYHVATLDLTSVELLKKLDKVAQEEERALIATWLESCDIVKYGGLRVGAEAANATLEDARALVVTTTQLAAANAAAAKLAPPAPPPPEDPDAPKPYVPRPDPSSKKEAAA